MLLITNSQPHSEREVGGRGKLHTRGVRVTALDTRDLGKEGILEAGAGRSMKKEGQLASLLLASRVHLRDRALNASSSATQGKWML